MLMRDNPLTNKNVFTEHMHPVLHEVNSLATRDTQNGTGWRVSAVLQEITHQPPGTPRVTQAGVSAVLQEITHLPPGTPRVAQDGECLLCYKR